MSNPRKIEREAALWVARKDAGQLAPEETRAFDAWCREDPRHLGAVVRLEAVNARLGRATALKGLSAGRPPMRRLWLPAAVAASFALAAATWLVQGGNGTATHSRDFATQIGEQYRTTLTDGSMVELNTATRLNVAFEPDQREIKLATGEAVFDVVHDTKRPFIVRTDVADVRAVGTIFSVRVQNGLKVEVAEGRVDIVRNGAVVARISAGDRYVLRPSGDAIRSSRTADEIQRSLAWREGNVAFAGETLGEASAELNRYNRLKIEISDPRVAEMRFGGYFRATDPEGFVDALQQSLPIEAERQGEQIVLRPKN